MSRPVKIALTVLAVFLLVYIVTVLVFFWPWSIGGSVS